MELPQQRAAQTFPGRKIDYTSEKKRTLAAEAKAKITTAKKNGDVPGITLGNVLPWDFSWNYSCDKHTALQSTCTAPKALWAGINPAVLMTKQNSPYTTWYGIKVSRAQTSHGCVWSQRAKLPAIQRASCIQSHSSTALSYGQIR